MAKIQELAHISDAIYKKVSWDGWEIQDMKIGWIDIGFKAGLYVKGEEKVICFCGSDDPVDWKDNLSFLYNKIPEQAEEAVAYYHHIVKKHGSNVILTGHSLGGALASVVGNIYGKKTVTFNSPGTLGSKAYYIDEFADNGKWRKVPRSIVVEKRTNKIDHYLIFEDMVNLIGFYVGKVHWGIAQLDGSEKDDIDKIKKRHSPTQWFLDERYDAGGNYIEIYQKENHGIQIAIG